MLRRQVLKLGTLTILLGMGIPTYSQTPEVLREPSPLECKANEENLMRQYFALTNLYRDKGKLVKRFYDKETKTWCEVVYELDKIDSYGTGYMFTFKKGIKNQY